jgi:adenylosuccinate lyase
MHEDLDHVSKLEPQKRFLEEYTLKNISPLDAKYREAAQRLAPYLSADAEWRTFAYVQKVILETRRDFGQAEQWNVDEVEAALKKISPLNMDLLEKEVTKHDQLAVIEEIGRFVSPQTKALMHPGTTSYDIIDTSRAYNFKNAWRVELRPEAVKTIKGLCKLSKRSSKLLQAGRTHLKKTTPLPLDLRFSQYAGRLADRMEKCDQAFGDLRGKISGMVGTGAGIDMNIGEGKSMEFEKAVLDKLGLKPEYTATQITSKERYADVGHGLTTMMHVLGKFANDMRLLYADGINEVTSRDNAERLSGSSADAMKNNPEQYEHVKANVPIVKSGMEILYSIIIVDLDRDLTDSKPQRYQPVAMMAEILESFTRINEKCLPQLSINTDKLIENLESVRRNPSEAMTSILRGEKWVHTKYGVGHDFVKEVGKKAKKENRPLLEVSLEDSEFRTVYDGLPPIKKDILGGKLEFYIGSAHERARKNISYARRIANKQ